MTSAERSKWYLLVNGKLEHRQLWYTIRRCDSEQCLHCNIAVETLKHKLSDCRRVTAAWTHLQRVLATIVGNNRRLSYDELIYPVLNGITNRNKIEILKLFIKYVSFIMSCDNAVDISELDFYLRVEL